MPAQGSLKISHNFAGETGYVIAVWRRSTVPLTIVGQQPYPAPHSQQSLLILGLEPDWYTVKFYRSDDGVTLGAEILTLAGNAATGAVYNTIRYEYVVDRGNDNTTPPGTGALVWNDPVNGTNTLRDERLKDKVYWFEVRGLGTFRTDEYDDRSDIGGGFDINTGMMWEPEQTIIAHVAVPQDIVVTSGVGSGEVSEIVVIVDDTDYDPLLHSGKLIVVEFAEDIHKLTIPNLLTVPDSFFKIQTHGSAKFCGIQLDVGDTVKMRGEELNVIWLGVGEEATIIFRENVMYVVKAPQGYEKLGRREFSDKLELNSVFRDGTQYDQSQMPRLMQFIDSLPASFVVAEGVGVGQWDYEQVMPDGETVYPNKGKFARTDTGTPKIRVPDSRNMYQRSLKSIIADAIDADAVTINPGGYKHDMFRSHVHTAKSTWHWFGLNGRGNLSSNNDAVRQESGNRTQDGLNTAGGSETRTKAELMLPILYI